MLIPPNRIKPLLLRDIKTEALLVFIRATLEQFFKDISNRTITIQIGSPEEQEKINLILQNLLFKLQDTIISSSTLRQFSSNPRPNKAMIFFIKKELPLLHYYDAIIQQIQISLKQGEHWIPEQLCLALLSEWVLEERKSIDIFYYLNSIDYINLLSIYDKVKLEIKNEGNYHNAQVITNMYQVAHSIIQRLKNTKYRVKF